MKYPQYIAVLVFCFLLMASGCGGDDASQALDRAEAIKDNHADSALAIIDSIHIDDIRDEAVRARYALLKTYVKANLQQLVAGDSSLIDIAVDYYEDKGMADEAAMARFSMRTVCLFCGLKEDNNYARKKRLMDRLKQTDPEGYDILQRILKRSPAERLASL